MSLPRTFKGILAVASGATAAAVTFVYTDQLYRINNQVQEADKFLIDKINVAYENLQKVEKCDSLLKKHLDPAMLKKLEDKKTKLGASLYDIIKFGLNGDTKVGLYAADTESYDKFAPLFNAVVKDYHGFGESDKQPEVDTGEHKLNEFAILDPDGKYIKSTRICCFRSVKGFPFDTLLSSDDYLILEHKIKNALSNIDDPELNGIYNPLVSMPKKMKDELFIDQPRSFNDDRQKNEIMRNHWPTGRGVYCNNKKTFMVWLNVEDHLSITSLQEGGDVARALDRLIRGMKAGHKTIDCQALIIESKVAFAYNNRLGWLTTSPTNLGCAVRAVVQIRLPKLSKKDNFIEMCDKLNLHASPVFDEHTTDNAGGYYFVSNKRSLGLTQYEAVKEMYDGVKELIRLEEKQHK